MYQDFNYSKYLIKRRVWSLMGKWTIYNPNENEVFYCEQKFSLKTDIHVYTGKNKLEEVLIAKTRQIIDFSAAYDIFDPQTNEKIGAVKRKGWKGLIKDEWIILNKEDKEIGFVKEDNLLLALLRRFYLNFLLPKKYLGYINQEPVFILQKHFNPFIWKASLDFSPDTKNLLDKRLGISLALIMCAIGERTN